MFSYYGEDNNCFLITADLNLKQKWENKVIDITLKTAKSCTAYNFVEARNTVLMRTGEEQHEMEH